MKTAKLQLGDEVYISAFTLRGKEYYVCAKTKSILQEYCDKECTSVDAKLFCRVKIVAADSVNVEGGE